RLQILGRVGVASERIDLMERATPDAEVRRLDAADRDVERLRARTAGARRDARPTCIEMLEKRRGGLGRHVVAEREVRRRRAAGEALLPPANAGGELRRIAEARRL